MERILNASNVRRLRGVMLEILYKNHGDQRTRLDHIMLWGVLTNLGYDVSQNDVLTLLQDLQDRDLVKFDEKKDGRTGYVSIQKIQITAGGRDVVELTTSEPAVQIL
jgi:hypothetical protein